MNRIREWATKKFSGEIESNSLVLRDAEVQIKRIDVDTFTAEVEGVAVTGSPFHMKVGEDLTLYFPNPLVVQVSKS
ncbi:MAG: hypothetical protein DRP42_07810 [Tenericutes bacterium]|nr:MAG: hypothetical protein DRP42_07810 [Mycoplasmatota bacterium]